LLWFLGLVGGDEIVIDYSKAATDRSPLVMQRVFILAAVVLTAIGLVFERFSVVKRYRFWQAFRDAKHGRPQALQLVERRFLEHLAS
jgi:hypothetical protein